MLLAKASFISTNAASLELSWRKSAVDPIFQSNAFNLSFLAFFTFYLPSQPLITTLDISRAYLDKKFAITIPWASDASVTQKDVLPTESPF